MKPKYNIVALLYQNITSKDGLNQFTRKPDVILSKYIINIY